MGANCPIATYICGTLAASKPSDLISPTTPTIVTPLGPGPNPNLTCCPSGILVRPITPRQRLVNHRHGLGRARIRRAEISSGHQRNFHGAEILRIHNGNVGHVGCARNPSGVLQSKKENNFARNSSARCHCPQSRTVPHLAASPPGDKLPSETQHASPSGHTDPCPDYSAAESRSAWSSDGWD